MTTFEAWILAAVGTQTGDEPWAGVYPTHAAAMRALRDPWAFEVREHYADDEQISEGQLRDALAGVLEFTIETTILDTEDFSL